MRVALFIPCFVDQLFPNVGIAMVTVLRRLNVEVDYPLEQTCCGQPAFNTGYWDEARELAKRYCEIFADAEAIVSPSGSCTAMVRNFYPELLGKATRVTARQLLAGSVGGAGVPACVSNTFEFSEFLVRKLGVTDVGARFPAKVTYHDACHALRELRLKNEPRELLRNVKGLELVEMSEAETCCGFGGTFSVKFPMISYAMDEVKCTLDPANGRGVRRLRRFELPDANRRLPPPPKLPVKTIHLAEVLAAR